MPLSRPLRAFAVLGIALTAACSDSTGPKTITDPVATISDLTAIDSAFNSPAFIALQQLTSNFPAPTAPLPFARLAAALRVTLPPSPAALRGRAALRRAVPRHDVPLLASLAAGPASAPVLPDTLLGVTFEWNPDSLRYEATSRTGAPLNGVRFILYATDTLTDTPDTAQEVGSLDVIDKAPALGAQLQFVVLGVAGSPTFLDYTLSFLPAASAFTIQAQGYISNGRPGLLERRFTFDAAITHTDTANGASEAIDFNYDVNVPDVTVNLHFAAVGDTLTDTTITVLDFRFTRRRENIRLVGTDTSTTASDDGLFTVTVNGGLYATATLTGGIFVIKDHTGAVVPIDFNDQQYEDDVFVALLLGGVFNAIGVLGAVLAIPAILLGITFGLL
jgi:hypothetical protein